MPSTDADLKEYRQLFADDTAEWEDIRNEGTTDMRYVAGDPWDPLEREVREKAGRPCLSLDELGQYTNQVVNEVRANKRAVKFAPVGNGATDKTAEFYADKMREIEYRSSAQIGYTTAFENAVQRSYGFCRVSSRYEHAKSVNQDLWIDPVHNPDLITPDPYALMPNMSDMKHCWVREPWLRSDFNRRWPKAEIKDGDVRGLLQTPGVTSWVTDRIVWVSELWKIRTTKRKLLIVQPASPMQPGSMLGLQSGGPVEPIGIFEDELDQHPIDDRSKVIREREVEDQSVYQCLTNGVEILEETPWLGRYIPIISCVGKVIYLDEGAGAKRKILSMVRLARDPFMAYCFYRTCEIENVGMTTKNPYWAYEGQLTPAQKMAVAKSMHEPVAVLEAKGKTDATGPDLLPLPQRNVNEPYMQGLSVGAEEMRRAIQAAMGQSPLPTSAQRRNEKSGVALKHIEETAQMGAFHFKDHYLDMIQHVGVIIEDLIDKIYDSPRNVGIRKPNDTAEIVPINTPGDPKSVSTKGEHLVTVSTGPSFDSEREAASEFADLLAQISPEVFMALGPLIIKLKGQGPIYDEMAELLEALQPPPIQQLRDSKKQPNDPEQAQKQLIAMKAQLEQVMQAAGEMQKAIETDQAKQQATIEKAKIDGEIQIQLQHLKNAATIRVAEIAAEVKGMSELAGHAAAHEELALGQAHESHEAEMARQAEQAAAERAHQQALEQAEQGQAHALEQGEQGHQQAMEQGDQAVAGQLAVEASKPKPQPKART